MKHARWAVRVAVVAAMLLVAGIGGSVLAAGPSGWLALDGSIRFVPGNGGTVDWANSGAPTPTYACPAGAQNVSGPGGLFNCGQFVNSKTPPLAPTLTPAAAVDPSIISAVFSVDPLSSDTAGCGQDPTTISGKNGDPINSYTVTAGSVPTKTDLTNVYGVSHTRVDNGHPEIYFAAERLVNNGESHIDFEFLQSTLTLGAGCGTRSITGSRTEGDLLIAVDFTIGGSLAGATTYQWHCVPEPGPQPPDGTVCDPPAANPSPPEHYEAITNPALLTAVSVLVNAVDVPCGGWACRDQTGAATTVVPTNDFLEGGVDLNTLGFKGCFNTFLPHTRSSQSFTALLEDFTGPLDFHSCRTPATASNSAPGGTVSPGASVTDTVTVANGGAGLTPTGAVTFFLCGPAQVTGSGCPSGTQVGAAKTLVGGAATSDPSTATNEAGQYCWRTVYAPDSASLGIYAPAAHTNTTSECFGVVAATLPNTGAPLIPYGPSAPVTPLLLIPFAMFAVVSRRGRVVAVLVLAGIVSSASPVIAPDAIPTPHGIAAPVAVGHDLDTRPAAGAALSTEAPRQLAWRVAIPRIGIDAAIEPVGRDGQGAMASPSSLDTVGWFNLGARPGQPGDAVLDGHFGLPRAPAVFRDLRLLRPGDMIQIAWPDGRTAAFRVASSTTVPLDAHPAGLFTTGGPARLSLITCAGAWDQSRRTYTQRLIVTADMI